jgi:hypothetical protein
MENIGGMPSFEDRESSEAEQSVARILKRAGQESEMGNHEEVWEWLEMAARLAAEAGEDIGEETHEQISETREKLIARMRPQADFSVAGDADQIKAKSADFLKKCENFELRTHSEDFTDDRELVVKFVKGDSLKNEESNRINKLRREWWRAEKGAHPSCADNEAKKSYLEEEYGSISQGCKNRIKITNILKDQKHVSLEEMKEESKKKNPDEMVNLWSLKNPQAVELKKQLEAGYPGQVEAIEALFGIGNFFDNEKALDEEGWTEAGKQLVQEITAYRFLLTDLIIKNTHNEGFVENFWQTMSGVAKQSGEERPFESLRDSTLSQAAVFRALEILGFKPKLSHPRADAFGASDLVLGDDVVQVVGLGEEQGMLADYIAFPGVEAVEKDGETTYVSDFITAKAQKFARKASSYDKNIKRGLMVGVSINQIKETGEPDEEFIQFLANKLGVKYEKNA